MGFAIANALATAGGALVAAEPGLRRRTMGFGILVNGLAALIMVKRWWDDPASFGRSRRRSSLDRSTTNSYPLD